MVPERPRRVIGLRLSTRTLEKWIGGKRQAAKGTGGAVDDEEGKRQKA